MATSARREALGSVAAGAALPDESTLVTVTILRSDLQRAAVLLERTRDNYLNRGLDAVAGDHHRAACALRAALQ